MTNDERKFMLNPVEFVKNIFRGGEPVFLLNLVAGAAAAGAAAAADVDVSDPKAVYVAAGWAALAFVERQLVRPEKVAKQVEEHARWVQDKNDQLTEAWDALVAEQDRA